MNKDKHLKLDLENKRIFLHGVPIDMVSDEECDKASASVHMRVKDSPDLNDKHSTIIQCRRCYEDIWINRHTPTHLPHYCMQCAAEMVDEKTETA